MKSFLLCLSLAGVFALALVARGVSLDVGDFLALGFASLLVGWFFASYRRKRRLRENTAIPMKGSGGHPRRKVA